MNEDTKPILPAIEADRREAIARHQGAMAAQAQGGDPSVVGALMQSEDGHPKLGDVVILGIHGNSFTAACIVAMELWGARLATLPTLTVPERSVALVLIYRDPKKAWQAMMPEDAAPFVKLIHHEIFDVGITMERLTEISRAVADITSSSKREDDVEDNEGFRKPAEPATTSPT